MATQRTSEVEPALLEAIQHARFHRKIDIALSLAFALERHRVGLATGRAQPWTMPQSEAGDSHHGRFSPSPPGDHAPGKRAR